MNKNNDFADLESELEGKNPKILREKTNILMSVELKERLRATYLDRSLGHILEEGALMKLRRDGHIPEKPKGAEPAGMDSYAKAKEKIALDEIKERIAKEVPKMPKAK